ncbi:uncharacterized protein PV09_08652 [Verruconis gallopava]|uniref:Uncharacterized protein n=1 Tax=Verruconis gallopava TaxID=253628 RepID=A0A0D1ZZ61_9PEZI|nr:uncharacterized protein PV09_08652 [Verruconis gallopava]KIV99722.1 hypothetical protein PV09_08652 [Verruconis gallopava]
MIRSYGIGRTPKGPTTTSSSSFFFSMGVFVSVRNEATSLALGRKLPACTTFGSLGDERKANIVSSSCTGPSIRREGITMLLLLGLGLDSSPGQKPNGWSAMRLRQLDLKRRYPPTFKQSDLASEQGVS